MTLRKHRNPVRERNKLPDFVRKAGPHVKQARYEPVICDTCGGTGKVYSSTERELCGYADYCSDCDGIGEL